MSVGNGAHVVHSRLQDNISGYEVCSYSPWLTAFPPLLWGCCSQGRPHLIHTTPDYAPFFTRTKTPLVITFHNYVLDKEMHAYGSFLQRLHWKTDLRWFTQAALKKALIVTAVSHYTADLVHRDTGYDKNIEVIPNGVNTSLFHPKDTQNRKEIQVLFSGNPTSRKGAQWLVAIANLLNPNINILCTGGLRNGQFSNSDRIRYLGPIPYGDMPSLYRSVDLLLLPTVREGHSLAILEAMSSGLPVVASQCSSLPEQIKEGKGGHLIKVGDISGYAEAINQLANKASLRKQFGLFNRKCALNKFSEDKMITAYNQLFTQAMRR